MKKISLIFLSFVIFIAPPMAYAGIGKYIINSVKHIGGGAKVQATNTITGAKHVITHGVSSGALGGAIGAGIVNVVVGGGVGLAFEVITGLALDAVDWVMDEKNNQLKWKEKGAKPEDFGVRYYKVQSGAPSSTAAGACKAYADTYAPYSYVSHSAISTSPSNTYDGTAYSYICKISNSLSNGTLDVSGYMYGYPMPPDTGYKTISLETLAAKTIDLAAQGKAPAVKTVEDYVKKIANQGKLDAELDASTDITKSDKECSAGYEKVGSICVKKSDDEKVCPADTVKVGNKCIKKPDKEDGDPTQCGDCCDEMMEILGAMAEMNAEFYANSLDNDAQMLNNLQLVNDQLEQLSNNFNDLLDEARQANQTLTDINNNQTLHFNELKNAIEKGNADILAKLAEIQAAIDLTNLKLDAVNLNLEKINENLEKMQKCEETEFNKKICDFIDWVKNEPSPSEENTVDVQDVAADNSNKINMSGECPAPYELKFSVLGYAQNHSISYAPLCGALTMLKPIFIGSGALSSMFILMGYSRASNTGVN